VTVTFTMTERANPASSRQCSRPFYSSRARFFFGGGGGKASHHPGLSAPLQPRFGSPRLTAFPEVKIAVEREEILNERFVIIICFEDSVRTFSGKLRNFLPSSLIIRNLRSCTDNPQTQITHAQIIDSTWHCKKKKCCGKCLGPVHLIWHNKNKLRDVNSSCTAREAKREVGESGCVACLGCGNNKYTPKNGRRNRRIFGKRLLPRT
jgi:hypothetical protein